MLAAQRSHPAALTVPLSCQATELLEAILEGYPKSKKQFFVSTEAGLGPAAVVALLGRGPCPADALCLYRRRLG